MTRDFLSHEWTYDCMGCAIADGSMQPPGGLIKTGQYFCVHQDPLIPLSGFLVIGARRHIRTIAEMGADEYREFAEFLRAAEIAIRAAVAVEHLAIVQEDYSSHFHLWYFPWTAGVVAQYGKPELTKIRAIMAATRQEALGAEAWAALEKSIRRIVAHWPG